MPIYLVRWPDLSASLVRARHEDDLIDILDQVANPDGCEWSVYQGPLFIDFQLPAEWHIEDERPDEPVTPAQVVVGDVGRMATEPIVGKAVRFPPGRVEIRLGPEQRSPYRRLYAAYGTVLDGLPVLRDRDFDGRAVSVTVNVATPDAQSFQRSEAQVSAAIARAVARGQRAL